MKKPTGIKEQYWPALYAVRKAGAVMLTKDSSKREWVRYTNLAQDGYLVAYPGAEPSSRVFMLRPAFRERKP